MSDPAGRPPTLRILGFGTYDVSRHPRVGILLAGLAAGGDAVEEINAPLGFTTAERVAMLQRPWTAVRMVARLLSRWWTLVREARRATCGARGGGWDAVLVGYLGHFDVVLARLLFPRSTIVLDQLVFAADTARDRGVSGGARVRLLTLVDRLAVACADLVLVDTEEHVGLLAPRSRSKALVVPVGAPSDWFTAGEVAHAGAEPAPDAPLRVVYFGLFTPLHGATVIGAALARLGREAEVRVTMIGHGQDSEAVRAAAGPSPAVEWVEWVEPDDLPEVVAGHDVCLGIFGTAPKALRVVPNKIYQGAAAGCALLTSDTHPQRRAFDGDAVFVAPGDPDALAEALAALAADRPRVRALQAAARRRAHSFTPAAVVAPLRARLASA